MTPRQTGWTALACAALLAASTAQSQPDPGAGRGGPTRVLDAAPEEMADRLSERLEQVDELRARMAEAVERLRAGEDPQEVLGPWAWRLMRGRPDIEGWLEEDGGPGRGPGFGPAGGPGLFQDAPDGLAGGPGGPPGEEPSVEEVRAFINEHLPALSARLSEAEAADPERAETMLRRLSPRLGGLIREHADDPAFVELRIEELRTGMEIVGAAKELRRLRDDGSPTAEMEEARERVRALLARQFDLRQRLEAHRLERMRSELETAEQTLAGEAQRRDEVIEARLERVLERIDRGRGEPRRGRGRP